MYKIKPFMIIPVDLLPGEIWAPPFDPEYKLKPHYMISNYGRICSCSRQPCRLLNQIEWICKYFEMNRYTGKSISVMFREISDTLGVIRDKRIESAIRHIKNRTAHTNISDKYKF